jgi:hypothetical protein
VWERTVKGLVLTFRLAGINNQNFLMRDDQTGTFWQQISGRAISGPLEGSQLTPVHSDELTFALWRSEAPDGSVLKPLARDAKDYETKDWDVRMAKVRTVLDFPNSGLQSRDLVWGVDAFGVSRAYPVKRIIEAKVIEDRLGNEPIVIWAAPDGKSIRAFDARIDESAAAPDFYRTADAFMDSETGSQWSFSGCAVSGKRAGTCLKPLDALKDYWFDWKSYHPATTIFRH